MNQKENGFHYPGSPADLDAMERSASGECDYCEKPSTHEEEGDHATEVCYFCDDHYKTLVLDRRNHRYGF